MIERHSSSNNTCSYKQRQQLIQSCTCSFLLTPLFATLSIYKAKNTATLKLCMKSSSPQRCFTNSMHFFLIELQTSFNITTILYFFTTTATERQQQVADGS